MASILQGGKRPEPAEPGHEPMHDSGAGASEAGRSTLVSHGDGTHHIEHEDGSQTDHPHIGHALMHLAGKHSEGMHHHVHHDGMGGGFTAHHAAHGGEPEGPHEHPDLESLKQGMDQFFGEEQAEGEHDGDKGSEGKDYD